MQFIIIIIIYVLQTTLLAKLFPFIKPDLFLILLAVCTSGRGMLRGLGWGLLIGFFLDIFSGYIYYQLYLYAAIGLFLGAMPGDYFRSYRAMVVTSVLIATGLIYLLFYFSSTLVFEEWKNISSGQFGFVLVANTVLAYFLALPLAKLFRIKVRDE